MRFLLISLLCASSLMAQAQTVKLLVQSSPLAGFQYHAGAVLWADLRVGDPIALLREPFNSHDPLAIGLLWFEHPIGYIPRLANRALARRLDAGLPTSATISALREHTPPWERVEVLVQAWV